MALSSLSCCSCRSCRAQLSRCFDLQAFARHNTGPGVLLCCSGTVCCGAAAGVHGGASAWLLCLIVNILQ